MSKVVIEQKKVSYCACCGLRRFDNSRYDVSTDGVEMKVYQDDDGVYASDTMTLCQSCTDTLIRLHGIMINNKMSTAGVTDAKYNRFVAPDDNTEEE